MLRESEVMNKIKGGKEIPLELDDKTEKAARYVAVAYDKLGFILKHDEDLERRVLEWHGDDIAEMWPDASADRQKHMEKKNSAICARI